MNQGTIIKHSGTFLQIIKIKQMGNEEKVVDIQYYLQQLEETVSHYFTEILVLPSMLSLRKTSTTYIPGLSVSGLCTR